MHTKHYIKFAEIIRLRKNKADELAMYSDQDIALKGIVKREELRQLSRDMADIFEEDNSRFKRERFLEACGTLY